MWQLLELIGYIKIVFFCLHYPFPDTPMSEITRAPWKRKRAEEGGESVFMTQFWNGVYIQVKYVSLYFFVYIYT